MRDFFFVPNRDHQPKVQTKPWRDLCVLLQPYKKHLLCVMNTLNSEIVLAQRKQEEKRHTHACAHKHSHDAC